MSMVHQWLVSQLILYLLVSQCDRGQCICVDTSCDKLKSYLDQATNISRWKDNCYPPWERFCSLLEKGSTIQVQETSDRINEKRSSVFEEIIYWKNHKSKIIQRVGQDYQECKKNGLSEPLRSRVIEYLERQDKLINERIKYDKVIYFSPKVMRTHAEIKKDVDSMEIETLCYHEMNSIYPLAIDRVYMEKYSGDFRLDEGRELIKQLRDKWNEQIKYRLDHAYAGHEAKMALHNYYRDLKSAEVKIGYPTSLMNNSQFDEMHDPPTQAPLSLTREKWWATSIHPDAVWFNRGENALYVTSGFFFKEIFDPGQPFSWKVGGLVKVFQAFMELLVQYDYQPVRLIWDPKLWQGFFEHLNRPQPSEELLQTFARDQRAIENLEKIVLEKDKDDFHGLSPDNLYHMRVYHDMCQQTIPKNSMAEYESLTGRLHGQVYVESYAFQVRRRQCFKQKFNSPLTL